MTLSWLGPVTVLALVDGTSIGTLVIPVWLMLAPRVRAGRLLAYLGVVATAYLVLGVVLLAGGTVLAAPLSSLLGSTPGLILQAVLGAALMVVGLTWEPWTKAGKERRAERQRQRRAVHGPTRMERWRESAARGDMPTRALVLLALTAVVVEAASMLPYLAALGLMGSAGLPWPLLCLVLAGYCIVMVAPALVLLGARLVLHERLAPWLTRLSEWLERNSREALCWVLFLVGLYLLGGAATELGWIR